MRTRTSHASSQGNLKAYSFYKPSAFVSNIQSQRTSDAEHTAARIDFHGTRRAVTQWRQRSATCELNVQ